jgi:hypothetical protein
MEEYPAHWKSTLMGVDFWKDAAAYEDEVAKTLQRGKRLFVLCFLASCLYHPKTRSR